MKENADNSAELDSKPTEKTAASSAKGEGSLQARTLWNYTCEASSTYYFTVTVSRGVNRSVSFQTQGK